MSRYDLPDPKCHHKPSGRVYAGSPTGDSRYVSTYVCDRTECIDDAKEWAKAFLAGPVHFAPLPLR